jgi:cytochrome P450 family 110
VLLTLDGERHLERRRLLLPFFREQYIIHHLTTIESITRRVIDSWPFGRPFALLPQLREISFQVIMDSIFGFDVFQKPQPIVKLLRRAEVEVYTSSLLAMPLLQIDLGRSSPWGRLKRLHAEACAALESEIQLRRATGNFRDRKDVLSQLLVHQMAHPGALTYRALRDELLTLLTAGFETTAFAACWVIECALSHPVVLDRIRAEVDAVLAGGPIARTHLGQLTYLDAVIHESLRHRMPSPIAGVRLVKKPISLLGYELPEGAFVSMSLAGLGLRPDLFPEPRQFRPERFMGRKYSVFEWNPFGSGTRQCIAAGLGQLELKVVLSTLLTRARLRLVDSDRRRERRGLFLVPRHGLRVVRGRL